MKCWNCGAELEEGVTFCSRCGRKQLHEGGGSYMDGAAGPGGEAPPPPPPADPPAGGPVGGVPGGDNTMILTIFSIVCLVVYGYKTVRQLIWFVPNLLHWFMSFNGLFSLVGGLLLIVGGVWSCLMLAMIAFKRTPVNSNGLIICLAGGGLVTIAGRVVFLLSNLIFARYPEILLNTFINLLETAAGAVAAAGGVYAIIRFVLGEPAISSFDSGAISRDVKAAFASFTQAAGDVGAQASQAAQEAQARRQAQQQAAYSQQQAAYNQQPGQVPPSPPGYGAMHMRTDRSILAYILLTLVTCGIYGWYFIYCLARDVNVVCAGDGKNTSGLGMYILLSIVTCGIYPIIWMYGLGNRLAANAPRYGMNFQENGTTVLLWYLVGALLCGIGPLVAMNIVINNTNSLCTAYNFRNGV